MTEASHREDIRRIYEYRCGYCGVHEAEAGTELELDHFQPRAAGGRDDLENLVYCCTTCNRLKSDFWPISDPSTATRRLLHPIRDDLSQHIRFEPDGHIVELSETGAFYIARFHLNRRPLLALRRNRSMIEQLRRELTIAKVEQTQLRTQLAHLERTLQDVLAQIARLLES